MERPSGLPEDLEKLLASSWARIAKDRLGKGPGGLSIECCGEVLMVTMHQTLTPLERTLAQATGGWEVVRELRDQAMQVVSTEFAQVLQESGLHATLVFCEVDVLADRQVLAFRLRSRSETAYAGG